MIPLSVPHLAGNEWEYIKDCLDTNWVSSVGSYVDKFENDIASFTGAKYAISTVNGTSALHISLILSGVQNEDLVIVPNITFIASCNAVKYCGADPLLIDVDADTWQVDLDLLSEYLAEKTIQKNGECYDVATGKRIKAIMPVHVLGNMCDIERLIEITKLHNIIVVEDATEALGSYYKGKHAGTFGAFGCFSFNGNKIITTGGGGMIVTNDEKLAKKAKHLTTQAKSDPFEYVHDAVGYNYRLVNVLAALGVAQLEQLDTILTHKKSIAENYVRSLSSIPGIKFQGVSSDVSPNNWLFTVSVADQNNLIKHLLNSKIQVRPFWVPMNQLPMFKELQYVSKNDISASVYENSISLPCSGGLSSEDQTFVISKILEFYNA